jgi:hypothetical protein
VTGWERWREFVLSIHLKIRAEIRAELALRDALESARASLAQNSERDRALAMLR